VLCCAAPRAAGAPASHHAGRHGAAHGAQGKAIPAGELGERSGPHLQVAGVAAVEAAHDNHHVDLLVIGDLIQSILRAGGAAPLQRRAH
jgi:hypothetical protein